MDFIPTFIFIYFPVYFCVYVQMSALPIEPEELTGLLRARVIGGCEAPDVGDLK